MVEDGELFDLNYITESELKRTNMQALILKHFWKRWKLEYLTSLRKLHKTTSDNVQKAHVVLVHNDIPQTQMGASCY